MSGELRSCRIGRSLSATRAKPPLPECNVGVCWVGSRRKASIDTMTNDAAATSPMVSVLRPGFRAALRSAIRRRFPRPAATDWPVMPLHKRNQTSASSVSNAIVPAMKNMTVCHCSTMRASSGAAFGATLSRTNRMARTSRSIAVGATVSRMSTISTTRAHNGPLALWERVRVRAVGAEASVPSGTFDAALTPGPSPKGRGETSQRLSREVAPARSRRGGTRAILRTDSQMVPPATAIPLAQPIAKLVAVT